MASRSLKKIQGLCHGAVVVAGSFRPDSTNAPTNVTGEGFTVARSNTGLFTVTFADKYNSLISCVVGMREAAATATFAQAGDYSAANRTLQIRVMQEATGTFAATDLTADADNVVNFIAIFGNMSFT